jgi:hypothetical protein
MASYGVSLTATTSKNLFNGNCTHTSINSTLMIVQSTLNFRISFEKKLCASWMRTWRQKHKHIFRYTTILYRCHAVNIGAPEFSLLQRGHTGSVLTQPQISTYWRKGAFPEENKVWPCSCQALQSSMEINNAWRHASTYPHAFLEQCLFKHRTTLLLQFYLSLLEGVLLLLLLLLLLSDVAKKLHYFLQDQKLDVM